MAQTTRERIVEAALGTLKDQGFAGASARAIARRGGFNQALIFYHFGSLNDLLLAALDRTAALRMRRYREVLEGTRSPQDLLRAAAALYREDLASGHVTVLSELIAGSLSRPELRGQLAARVEPWVELAEGAVRGLLAWLGLEGILPPRPVALAVVALYLGADLLSHLDPGRREAEALFELAERVLPLLASLQPPPETGPTPAREGPA